STVTLFSSIPSNNDDCVLGDVRFTSSAKTILPKIGPGRNSKSSVFGLYIETPVISDGNRSGVNCILLNSQSSDLANDRTSIVLPTPGTSSINTCPRA